MISRIKFLYKFIFFVFLIFSFKLHASNLIINGLSKLSFEDLQSLTSLDIEKKSFTDNEINKIIFDLYKSDLIYDIILNKEDNIFYLTIDENRLVENIYINGNVQIKDELIIENLSIKKNTFLNKDKINKDIDLIKNIYFSKGFNNVNVVVSSEKFSKDRVNLIYNINEGKISKIKRIKFVGNDTYSDKYLSSLINSRSLSFYNLFTSGSNLNTDNFDFDVNKLTSHYKSKGFFDVKVNYDISQSYSNSYILSFYIDEGERIKIDDIYFDDQNQVSEEYISYSYEKFIKKLSKNNNFYDKSIVDQFLDNLNENLIKNNNYNSVFEADILNQDGFYYLKVSEEKVKTEVINSISIYGNNITKDKTIRSKLNFQPGDYFNKNVIDISKKNLLRYKYINNLDIQKITNDGIVDIIVDIDENKKTGQIMAAGSFSGDVGAGLQLGIKDTNIFGSGNNLDTTFLINDENTRFNISLKHYPIVSSKISNQYTIFNTESNLKNSFGFESEVQGASYSLNFEYNENIDVSSGLSYKHSNRHSPLKNTSPINDNIGKFDIYTIDLSLKYDSTNDFLYPTNGASNSMYIEYSPDGISDDNYFKVLLRSDLYRKFKNSDRFLFLSNDIGLAETSSNKLKTTYAYSLGGLNFKGFDYRGIGPKSDGIYLGGNRFFTSTLGIGGSFLFDDKDNIRTKLFYTVGSLWDSDYTSQNDLNLRSSVGVSLDVLTEIGPISFSYAIPIEKNDQDRTREFNFTIGTSF